MVKQGAGGQTLAWPVYLLACLSVVGRGAGYSFPRRPSDTKINQSFTAEAVWINFRIGKVHQDPSECRVEQVACLFVC